MICIICGLEKKFQARYESCGACRYKILKEKIKNLLPDEQKEYYEKQKAIRDRFYLKNKSKNKSQEELIKIKEKRRLYYQNNKERIKKSNRTYRHKNKEKYQKYFKEKRQKNIEKCKEYEKKYRQKNKDLIRKKKNKYLNERMAKDPGFKLRKRISNSIFCALVRNRSTKNNISILKFLPYTIEDLKRHLEKQFEPWMNWSNWGRYSDNWDDNDSSTWTWQIDHIIPQFSLPYTSMEDENFKKCWALENLRPLSSKINSIEGAKLRNSIKSRGK